MIILTKLYKKDIFLVAINLHLIISTKTAILTEWSSIYYLRWPFNWMFRTGVNGSHEIRIHFIVRLCAWWISKTLIIRLPSIPAASWIQNINLRQSIYIQCVSNETFGKNHGILAEFLVHIFKWHSFT